MTKKFRMHPVRQFRDMRVRDRHTVKRLSICNTFNSSAIQCCTARVVITSCLGANMRQRVNVLWRQRENFCCDYTPTLRSETWFSSSALIRHNVLIDTMIFNQLEGEKVSFLISSQLAVVTDFLQDTSHHLNHRWSHTYLPIKRKWRDHNNTDKIIMSCHFILHVLYTVQSQCNLYVCH